MLLEQESFVAIDAGFNQVSCRWTSSPKVRPGFEPGLPPYRGGVPPVTLADRSTESRPGRTRTCAILLVRQASWPLDDGTGPVAEVGVEPTSTSLSNWRLCQFAYPAILNGQLRAWESNPNPEFMRLGRAPALPQSPRGDSNSHAQDGHEHLRLARLPFRHSAMKPVARAGIEPASPA